MKKIQVKTFARDGSLADVVNVTDEPSPGGVADLELGQVERGQRVDIETLVQLDDPSRTYVLRDEATVRLRPNLRVALDAPMQTLTTRPVDVVARVEEVNGETSATATLTLSWGDETWTETVNIAAGGDVSVPFPNIALSTSAPVVFTAELTNVDPAETNAADDSAAATVDVTDFELAPSRLVVPNLGGFGTQFNQHVYANITPTPPGSLPALEDKVNALEPQFVRIFYNDQAEGQFPDRMESFIETVALANETGAAINITYQTAVRAKLQPTLYMHQFADVLEDLVRNRGDTNVRWVTIQNEPNTTAVTLEQYEAMNRALDAELVTRGMSDQIGIMGGDLVQSGQRTWFQYMAEHMNDIVDAYSEHVYWDYWDTPKIESRLRDIRKIVSEELPVEARKPIYITEYGVRGIQNFPGKPTLAPGYWSDGTQITRTNVAAFQQLWFNVMAAQLGFDGTAKWDAYWGKYDNGNQAHWTIGPATEGWPLFPTYHALRLLFQTTASGWQVLGVDPWMDDDWISEVPDQAEREVAAFAAPTGALTVIGLDTNGRLLNEAASQQSSYSIGGLPAFTTFNLAIWNGAGDGLNQIRDSLTTNVAGVARFDVPLHGAFALTTVPVS